MELGKYRPYKDDFQDNGLEVSENLTQNFTPDFYNRNTIQSWNISAVSAVTVSKWKGATLTDRTVHEITIVNNSIGNKSITFSSNYSLPDSDVMGSQTVNIGANGTAHFYATAILSDGNLQFTLRKGSQDKRNL